MSVYEGAFYLVGLAIAAAGLALIYGPGMALFGLGAGLMFVAIVGEWDAEAEP